MKKLPNLAEGQILDDEEMSKFEGGGPCPNLLKKATITCNNSPAIVITPPAPTPTPTPTPTPKPVLPPTTTLASL